MDYDTDVLIIGAGMSGIGFAVQLIRQLGTRNFRIIEKSDHLGGTWWINSYPGCGCDVPSHFFSYSFALNPDWSQKFAMQPEIFEYFRRVAGQYGIEKHVQFKSSVESAEWDDISGTWTVTVRDLKTSKIDKYRSKILISAVGALSTPNKCDIPGADTFNGKVFHTALWDHSFDWKDKETIIVGNGCSATQIVPVMSSCAGAVKRITQFSRQAHWLAERPNPEYSSFFKWVMRWIPFAMRIYRAKLYWEKERDFQGLDVETGAEIRSGWTKEAADYIRANAPARYRDFLVPKTEIGCKRRVNDTEYLACLHRDNVELVYDDPIEEIVKNGARTKSGRIVKADAIILANGFETQKPLAPMKVIGQNGISITDHWDKVSEGAPSSYLGTCLSGFPNFFIMMGPNTLSGHLSVIYTSECQINFTMRLIKPIIQALRSRGSIFPYLSTKYDVVDVKPSAEQKDIDRVQEKAKKLVWATGCTSWFIDTSTNRNTIMFPDWQYKFWLSSVFVSWKDFTYSTSKRFKDTEAERGILSWAVSTALVSGMVGLGALYLNRQGLPSHFESTRNLFVSFIGYKR